MPTTYPQFPPGNPLTEAEFELQRRGFVPATKLDAWKTGGCEVVEA